MLAMNAEHPLATTAKAPPAEVHAQRAIANHQIIQLNAFTANTDKSLLSGT